MSHDIEHVQQVAAQAKDYYARHPVASSAPTGADRLVAELLELDGAIERIERAASACPDPARAARWGQLAQTLNAATRSLTDTIPGTYTQALS